MPKAAYAVINRAVSAAENPLGKIIADNKAALASEGGPIWVMLESPARFFFDCLSGAINWHEWIAGRIFGMLGEIRFWERAKSIHVVIITDADSATLNGFTAHLRLDPAEYKCALRPVHLWHGNREAKDGVFEETRLPRGLRYPLPVATNNPGLETKEYVCLGIPEFIRFSKVIGFAD